MQNEFFQITSLLYIILLIFVFFLKKKPKSLLNTLYSYLIITNFAGLIVDILAYLFSHYYRGSIVSIVFCKLLLIYYCGFVLLMTLYIYVISHRLEEHDDRGQISINKDAYKMYKINRTLSIVIFILAVVTIVLFKVDVIYVEKGLYTAGIPVSATYVLSVLALIAWIFWMIKSSKIIKSKEFLPVFAFFIFSTIVMVIQYLFPWLLLMASMESFIIVIMYFTLENPDMKLIEQLNLAKDTADKANNAKTEFLSSMSHEIRTPLNAIVGFSTGLLDYNLEDAAKEDVNNVIVASNNLLELVNGILDISKIEAGKLEIIETNYSFEKMFNELILLTKSRIGEKPIDFRYRKDPAIPEYLYGDGSRLKEIILNLLTNSAKYTNQGYIDFNISYVVVSSHARLIISVEDSGIGIKEENINKIFEKFDRADVERNTTIEGTGLGLAITKRLVEMMNGKIIVNSVFGKGSKFTVIIEQGIPSAEEVGKIKIEAVAATTTEVNASGKKVLVVDDNELNLKVAKRLLQKYNVDVETVNSGADCIDKILMEIKYDLILMDDMMPKMSGTETLQKLKEDSNFNIPVVVLTANAISGMREEYLKSGFDDYLAKPIEKTELERIISKYLSN